MNLAMTAATCVAVVAFISSGAPLAAAICLAAGMVYVLCISPWIAKKQAYAQRFTACGALPPKPTAAALRRFKRVLKVILFIAVGKVRYYGLENIRIPGPKLITPNHGSYADGAVILPFEETLRSLAAQGLFAFGNGLGAALFGPVGAIPVDLKPGQGKPAADTAINVVAAGDSLLMFPEGWAYMDGHVGRFKKGAVRIARAAAAKRGRPVHIIPVYMRYARYPGKWILRYPPPVQYLLAFLLSARYRRGLTVVFGKPISSSSLPADDATATAVLRDAVLALDPATKISARDRETETSPPTNEGQST